MTTECRNFFNDSAAAPPLRRSTSFPVEQVREEGDGSIELNLSLSLGGGSSGSSGEVFAGARRFAAHNSSNNNHGSAEPVRSQLPVYPSLDKQRSGNWAADASAPAGRHGDAVASANSGEKPLFGRESTTSKFGLPSRDQVWQSLLQNGAVFGPPSDASGHPSQQQRQHDAAAAAAIWNRRAASVQIVMPFRDMNDPIPQPIRRACSNDAGGQIPSRQMSDIQLSACQIKGLESINERSMDRRNSSLHQEAMELQKRKEMQAQRRFEARKRRRQRTFMEEKQVKKVRQNSGGPLQRMNSKQCVSPNDKFSHVPVEDTPDVQPMALDDSNKAPEEIINKMNRASPKEERGATAISCDSINHGNFAANIESSQEHHRDACLSSDEHELSNVKKVNDDDRMKVKASLPSSSGSMETKEQAASAAHDSSEHESSSHKDATSSDSKVGSSTVMSSMFQSRPITSNGVASLPLPAVSYTYSVQGAPSASGEALQTNLSLSPFKKYTGAENDGSNLWHPSAGKLLQSGSGSMLNSSSRQESIGISSEGRWRDNGSEKSAFFSVRRTTSNVSQAVGELHPSARAIESPASVSSPQLSIARTMSSYVPMDSRENGKPLCNLKSPIERQQSWPVAGRLPEQSTTMDSPMLGKLINARQETNADSGVSHADKTSFGSNESSSFTRLRRNSGSFADPPMLNAMGVGLPMVTTTGRGPNGKTISGFMYITDGRQVRLICSCHDKHMSPAEFVEHSGSTDLSHPERNIVVNSLPFLNRVASTPV